VDTSFLGISDVSVVGDTRGGEGQYAASWELSRPSDGLAGPAVANEQKQTYPVPSHVGNARHAAQLRSSSKRPLPGREQRSRAPSGQRRGAADSRTRPRQPRISERLGQSGLLGRDEEIACCLAVQVRG
jgi:hypothetical protein